MAFIPGSKTVYPLLGRPHDSLPRDSDFAVSTPVYNGASYDASTTNLTYSLGTPDTPRGLVNVTLSFVSPITPTSTFRQSLPAAYLAIYVYGQGNVSVYADVNGQWISGLRGSEITWQFSNPLSDGNVKSTMKSWTVSRKDEEMLTESADRAEWGTLYFSGPGDATHQAGTSALLRQHFASHGFLQNTMDKNFRSIMDREPVFAFSKTFSLGYPNNEARYTSLGHGSSMLLSFALIQDPVVQFASARGLTYMRPLWASYMPRPDAMVSFHYADFLKASILARDYSERLSHDAQRLASRGYEDIVALSARQVLGATQFSGTPENPILFLKEISSNGNFQTVDVIFPAFPFFLYTNPKWLAYLLEPLIEHQLSGQYPNDYSMHDLGAHFPNATGHADGKDEYMPVEECGNMLIMALALVNALRDTARPIPGGLREDPGHSLDHNAMDEASNLPDEVIANDIARNWASRGYRLWKQWTGYLVRESLIPRNQLCTDDFAGWLANQTNLALKGIIGIRAMSELADLVGKRGDAEHYRNISESYIDQWQALGISRDGTHAKLSYTWYGSWTTIYNLYTDALLCFHMTNETKKALPEDQRPLGETMRKSRPFIPRKVYEMLSDWYHAVLQHYGLPLDSRHLYTKSDWQLFAASVVSHETRKSIIEAMASWVNETITDRPFTDLYDTEGKGDFSPVRFMARPVVGGHFAPLALRLACNGEAVSGLEFLEGRVSPNIDVAQALASDIEGQDQQHGQQSEEL